jgi:hypothetical protein
MSPDFEKIRRILNEHFENLTPEEFSRNLEEACPYLFEPQTESEKMQNESTDHLDLHLERNLANVEKSKMFRSKSVFVREDAAEELDFFVDKHKQRDALIASEVSSFLVDNMTDEIKASIIINLCKSSRKELVLTACIYSSVFAVLTFATLQFAPSLIRMAIELL